MSPKVVMIGKSPSINDDEEDDKNEMPSTMMT
jgi:hypothetical protein